MPRLNRLGDAVCGIAGAQTSVNGAVPADLVGSAGGGWDWFNNTEIIGQGALPLVDPDPSHWYIYRVVVVTGVATLVVAAAANNLQAGGDIYEKWWIDGLTTNVPAVPSLPLAGIGAVDFDGTWAVATSYGAGSGVTVYSAAGVLLRQSVPTGIVPTGATTRVRGDDTRPWQTMDRVKEPTIRRGPLDSGVI